MNFYWERIEGRESREGRGRERRLEGWRGRESREGRGRERRLEGRRGEGRRERRR